jgi:hypothetical protein
LNLISIICVLMGFLLSERPRLTTYPSSPPPCASIPARAIFVLTIAGTRRRVVQIKAIEKYGLLRL